MRKSIVQFLAVGTLGPAVLLTATLLAASHASLGEAQAQRREQRLMSPAQGDSHWLTQTVTSSGMPPSGQSLALDGSGAPHLAYGTADDVVKYATLTGTTWVSEKVATRALAPMLVLDNAGSPHIAYTQRGPDVVYATLSGTVWVTDTVDGDMAAGASLVLDGAGHPHLAYQDVRPRPPNGPGRGIMYAHWTGSAWDIDVVDGDVYGCGGDCDTPPLALDASGRPHMAYRDTADDTLKYATLDGGSWATEVVDTNALGPSLVLDGSGSPRIAYTQRGPDVTYAVRAGATWSAERVDGEMRSPTRWSLLIPLASPAAFCCTAI